MISTAGDRGEAGGDKARWVSEHRGRAARRRASTSRSTRAKDVPIELPGGTRAGAVPRRARTRATRCVGATSLAELPGGARVGTSSLRRRAQLRRAAPRPRASSSCAATSTRACASSPPARPTRSCSRSPGSRGWVGPTTAGAVLDELVPAPGRARSSLQTRGRRGERCRRDHRRPRAGRSARRARAARARSGGSCDTPVGAHARRRRRWLRAWVGLPDGRRGCRDRRDDAAAARLLSSPRAQASCCAARRRWRERRRDRLPGRRRPRRPGADDGRALAS